MADIAGNRRMSPLGRSGVHSMFVVYAFTVRLARPEDPSTSHSGLDSMGLTASKRGRIIRLSNRARENEVTAT